MTIRQHYTLPLQPTFQERTKQVEVNCHYIREKLESTDITARFVNPNEELDYIFTKSLRGSRIDYFQQAWHTLPICTNLRRVL